MRPTRCTSLLAVLFAIGSASAADQVGPFAWARWLYDPVNPLPTAIGRNGDIEAATLVSGDATAGRIQLQEWQGDNQAGSRSFSGNAFFGEPGRRWWIGAPQWDVLRGSDATGTWVYTRRTAQHYKWHIGYAAGSAATLSQAHGGASRIGSGGFGRDALVLELPICWAPGGGSGWQLGYYGGVPPQAGVWQVPAGSSLAVAQASQANRLADLGAILSTFAPDNGTWMMDLAAGSGGSWTLRIDRDGDGAPEWTVTSADAGCKPGLASVDGTQGLLMSLEAAGANATGYVGRTPVTVAYGTADEVTGQPVVTLEGPGTVAESVGSVSFIARLDRPAPAPVQVVLSTSSPDIDYHWDAGFAPGQGSDEVVAMASPMPGAPSPRFPAIVSRTTLTIPAGQTQAAWVLTVADDHDVEAAESASVSIVSATGATVGTPVQAGVTITDNDIANAITVTESALTTPESAGSVTIPLALERGVDYPVWVRVAPGNGTADGADVSLPNDGWIEFLPGATTASIVVDIVNDSTDEGPETIHVGLREVRDATMGQPDNCLLTITDRPAVGFAIITSVIPEGSGPASITTTLEFPTGHPVTVPLVTSGSATPGSDYTLSPTAVTIAAGETTGEFVIQVIDDTATEADETITVAVGQPTGAIVTEPTSVTFTIPANDAVDAVSVAFATTSAAAAEAAGAVTARLALDRAAPAAITVTLTTSGTADGSDISVPATVVIPAEATFLDIPLVIAEDELVEGDETVTVTIQAVDGGQVGSPAQYTLTIHDNDGLQVRFAASGSVVSEGAGVVAIPIRLATSTTTPTTVRFSLAPDRVGDAADAVIETPEVIIPAGATTAVARVRIVQDTLTEAAEDLSLHLSSPTASVSEPSVHLLHILDDDTAANAVSFAQSGTVATESAGTISAKVVLAQPAAEAVTVAFSVAGTAGASDRLVMPSPVTIAAGKTEAAIVVGITPDEEVESAEDVRLTLIGVSGVSGLGLGSLVEHVITIEDDDTSDASTLSFAVFSGTSSEAAGSAGPTVQIAPPATTDLVVGWRVIGGTAAPDDDLLAEGSVTIPAGVAAWTLPLGIVDDVAVEGDETAVIEIVSAPGVILASANRVTWTITDNEPSPIIAFAIAETEAEEGAGTTTVTLTIDQAVPRDVSVRVVAGAGSTALPIQDYLIGPAGSSQPPTIPAGETSVAYTIRLANDDVLESDEVVVLKLVDPSAGVQIGSQDTLRLTILDDEVETPKPTPETGVYKNAVTVELTARPDRARIYYTTSAAGDPADPVPGETGTTEYVEPIELTSTTTIKALALLNTVNGPVLSGVFKGTWVIAGDDAFGDENPSGASPVSPYCWVITSGPAMESLTIRRTANGLVTTDTPVRRAGPSFWYANVALDAQHPVQAKAEFPTEDSETIGPQREFVWTTTDLTGQSADDSPIVIRRRDSLLFIASGAPGTRVITGGNGAAQTGTEANSFPISYEEPGEFIATATVDGVQVGQRKILVVDSPFSSNRRIIALVESEREWSAPITPAAAANDVDFVSGDPSLMTADGAGTSGDAALAHLTVHKRGTPNLVARLSPNGPILDFKEVQEFEIIHEAKADQDGAIIAHPNAEVGSGDRDAAYTGLVVRPSIEGIRIRLAEASFRYPSYDNVIDDLGTPVEDSVHPAVEEGDQRDRYPFALDRESLTYTCEVFDTAQDDARVCDAVVVNVHHTVAGRLSADGAVLERDVWASTTDSLGWTTDEAIIRAVVAPAQARVDERLWIGTDGPWDRFVLPDDADDGSRFVIRVPMDINHVNQWEQDGTSGLGEYLLSFQYEWPGMYAVELDQSYLRVTATSAYLILKDCKLGETPVPLFQPEVVLDVPMDDAVVTTRQLGAHGVLKDYFGPREVDASHLFVNKMNPPDTGYKGWDVPNPAWATRKLTFPWPGTYEIEVGEIVTAPQVTGQYGVLFTARVLGREIGLGGGISREVDSGLNALVPGLPHLLGRDPTTHHLRYRRVAMGGFGGTIPNKARYPVTLVVQAEGTAHTGATVELRRSHDRVRFFTSADGTDEVFAAGQLTKTYNPADWFAPDSGWQEGFRKELTLYAEYEKDDEVLLTLTCGANGVELEHVRLSQGIGAPDGLTASVRAGSHAEVSLGRGNLHATFPLQVFDTVVPGPDVAVSYNSLDHLDVGLGCGWRHTYDVTLYVTSAAGEPVQGVVVLGDGTRVPVGALAGTGRAPGVEVLARPSQGTEFLPDEEFRVTLLDNRRLYFDRPGHLLRIRDLQGRDLTVSRDAQGRALKVTDSVGREVDLGREALTGDTGTGSTPLATLTKGVSGDWSFAYAHPKSLMTTLTVSEAPEGATGRFTHGATSVATGIAYNDLLQVATVTLPTVQAAQRDGSIESQVFATTITYGDVRHPTDVSVTTTDGGTTQYTLNPGLDAWTRMVDAVGVTAFREYTNGVRRFGRSYVGSVAEKRLLVDLTYDGKGRWVRRVETCTPSPAITTEAEYTDLGIPGTSLLTKTTVKDVTGIEGVVKQDLVTVYDYYTTGRKTGLLLSIADPTKEGEEFTVKNLYDENGFLIQTIDGLGNPTTFTDHTTYGDPRTTIIPVDTRETPATETTPAQTVITTRTVTRTYDDEGRTGLVKTATDPLKLTQEIVYDRLRRAVEVKLPGNLSEKTTYDPLGAVTSVTDVRNQTSTTTYDALGRTVSTTVPHVALPVVTHYTRVPTPEGTAWAITVTQGTELRSKVQIDAAGRQVKQFVERTLIDGDESVVEVAYETRYQPATGFPSETLDARGKITKVIPDDAGRVIKVQGPMMAEPKEVAVYNEAGWIVTSKDEDGVTTRFSYDAAGRQKRVFNARDHVVESSYDEAGRHVASKSGTAKAVTFAHEMNGARIGMTDRYGNTATTTVDAATRLVQTQVNGDPRRTTTQRLDDKGWLARVESPTGTLEVERTTAGDPDRVKRSGRLATRFDRRDDGAVTATWSEGANGEKIRPSAVAYNPDFGRTDTQVNADGLVAKPVRDATGAVIGSEDNADAPAGQPTQTQANGKILEIDRDGNVLRSEDAEHRVTTREWDDAGRLKAVMAPGAPRIEYTYTAAGRPKTTTNVVTAEVVTTTYNNLGLQEDVESSVLGLLAHTEYTSDGLPFLQVTPEEERITEYDLDTRDVVSVTVNGDGQRYIRERGLLKRVERIPGGEGGEEAEPTAEPTVLVAYRHDPLDRVEAVVYPDSTEEEPIEERIERDENGDVIAVTDRGGSRSTIERDGLGRVTAMTVTKPTANGGSTQVAMAYEYENPTDATVDVGGTQVPVALGSRVTVRENGQATVRVSDRRSRLRSVQAPGQPEVSYTYNRANQPLQMGTASFGYDDFGRVASVSQQGVTVQYTYDDAGRVATESLPGISRTFGYDGAGRLVDMAQQVTGDLSEAYSVLRDRTGRMLRVTGPEGTTGYVYDRRGRLIAERLIGAPGKRSSLSVSSYDANNNRTAMTIAEPGETGQFGLTWGVLNELPAFLAPQSGTWTAGGGEVDAAGAADATSLAGLDLVGDIGPFLSVEVDVPAAGLAAGQSRSAGMAIVAADGSRYEALLRVADGKFRVQVRDVPIAGAPRVLNQSEEKELVANLRLVVLRQPGKRLFVQAEAGGVVHARANAACLRGLGGSIALVASGSGATTSAAFAEFTWDRLGTRQEQEATYSIADRLLRQIVTEGDRVVGSDHEYDDWGNLTKVTQTVTLAGVEQGTPTATDYGYDGMNRLTSVVNTVEGAVTYGYLPGGHQRASSTRNGVATQYRWEGSRMVAETTGDYTRSYVFGRGSAPVAEVDSSGALSYARDLHGNITAHIGQVPNTPAGPGYAAVRTFAYDAWGQVAEERFRHADPDGSVSYRVNARPTAGPRYRGMWFDGDSTGMYKTQTRFYQPGLGRFTQVDPARDGVNWYAYAEGDPINKWDPTGLFTMEGMYQEFFNKYGMEGAELLMLAAAKGYTVEKRGYWQQDWYIESGDVIGIKATNAGFERSDANAAAQLMEALREVHYREVQLPNVINSFAEVDGDVGGFWLYYYTVGKEIGFSTVAEGAAGFDIQNQVNLTGGQRGLYIGVGTVQGVLTLAPAGGLAKGATGRLSGNLARMATMDVTMGAGRYLTNLAARATVRTMAAAFNNRLGAAAGSAFMKLVGKSGAVKGEALMLPHERAMAKELAAQGNVVEAIQANGVGRTADWFVNGVRTEFKQLQTTSLRGLKNNLQDAAGQLKGAADEILIDARSIPNLTAELAMEQIGRAAGNKAILNQVTITIVTQGGVLVRTGASGQVVWMPLAMGAGAAIPSPSAPSEEGP